MTCPCGCDRAVKPGNTYAALGCSLRHCHRDPERAAARIARHRQAFAVRRLDRWAQPAYERLARGLQRDGLALTRRQQAIVKLALADAVAQAYHQGRHAQLEAPKWHQRKGAAA